MGECVVCGEFDGLKYTCNHCSRVFCSEHRLPESHSCPALINDKINEKWFDEKFENVDDNKSINNETNVSRSDGTYDSKRPSESLSKKLGPDGNYTVADANPDKYGESGDYSADDATTDSDTNSGRQDNETKPDGNYTVADANPDKYGRSGNYSPSVSPFTQLVFILLISGVIILSIHLFIL